MLTGNKLCNVASRLRGKGFNIICPNHEWLCTANIAEDAVICNETAYSKECADETVVIKTCLKESDGTFQLNRAHKYYYQVQTQLLLSDNDYVDFVLWTMKGLHIERIEPDFIQ